MYRMRFSLLVCLVLAYTIALSQTPSLYPTHWFTGMKLNTIQLLVHANGIGQYSKAQVNYAGVKLIKVTKAESPNYLIIDLQIAASAKPGTMQLNLVGKENSLSVPFELKARRPGRGSQFAQGVTSKDLVYLIMPDRFANGDAGNDKIPGYKDTICDRSNPSAHHGGDIQGVINQLPYLKNAGVSAVWMCPVMENDMPWKQEPGGAISGYHGYWITNHYAIDKRYGGPAAYKQLADKAHAANMKIVQDAVYNHVGDEHFLFKDKPFAAMFNNWPTYTGSNHRDEAIFGPYSSAADKKTMLDGWFTPHLPDLNLANPYMANFIIQNTVWCTEEFGVDAWRVDTYKYCDEPFLNRINDVLLAEYPTLTVFGEAWCNTVVGSAYFARNNMNLGFKHNLQGVTDFPMQSAMVGAVNQPFGWNEGINRLMTTLSQDGLYKDPLRNCIFLDNHDMDRFATMVNGNWEKYKMGIGLLLTQRGIPQLYFGTEIGMQNANVNGDGKKRNDFPGGFATDASNKFAAAGRTDIENELFDWVTTLANFRKQSPALTVGTTHDYLPIDGGVYVYFRKTAAQTVMCVVNTATEQKTIDLKRYADNAKGFTQAKNVHSNASMPLSGNWQIPAQTIWVLALGR